MRSINMAMKPSEAVTLAGCVLLCIGGVLEWREHKADKVEMEKVWIEAEKVEAKQDIETKDTTEEIPFATD